MQSFEVLNFSLMTVPFRLGMTKNWKNINLITTHLFKAGSAVNMSGNVHQAQTDVDNENDEGLC